MKTVRMLMKTVRMLMHPHRIRHRSPRKTIPLAEAETAAIYHKVKARWTDPVLMGANILSGLVPPRDLKLLQAQITLPRQDQVTGITAKETYWMSSPAALLLLKSPGSLHHQRHQLCPTRAMAVPQQILLGVGQVSLPTGHRRQGGLRK